MKSFTDGGGKGNHAVVRGVRSRASLVDKSNKHRRKTKQEQQCQKAKKIVYRVARK